MRAAVGSVVAAALASACCLGPLLLGAIGAGGLAAAAVRLEPFRPIFVGGTALLLAFAFYGAYRRTPACDANGSCPAPSRRIARLID